MRLELGRDALAAPPPPPWEEPVPVRGSVHTALSLAASQRALAVSSQAAPRLDSASGASSGPGRSASLWSRVGAWFSGLGSEAASRGAGAPVDQEPLAGARADVVPEAAAMLTMPSASTEPAAAPPSLPSSTPATEAGHDPERTAS